MGSRTEKIDQLLVRLQKTGADPRRLDVLRCTQRFKRTWVDLAQILVEVRKTRAYEEWGYDDFHKYASDELQLRRGTVDKLTISFHTLQRHAPQVLGRDGLADQIPSYQSIDYFARAVEPANDGPKVSRRKAPGDEAVAELRTAVFDEGRSVGELRKRFDPVFHPKPKGVAKLEVLGKAGAAARRLAELLPDIDGLSPKRVRTTEQALGALRQELEALAAPLRERYDKGRRKPPKRVAEQD